MAKKIKIPLVDLGDEKLGERIARLRKARGYSQVDLAQKMGIVRVLISDYERSKLRPHPGIIIRFAKVFEISTDELLGLKPSKKNNDNPNLSIQKRIRKIEELTATQQRPILQTIDAYIRGVQK